MLATLNRNSARNHFDDNFATEGDISDTSAGVVASFSKCHRWYDSSVGQWVSEDPIGFDGGDANLTRYVGNGPTLFSDPNGLCAVVCEANETKVEFNSVKKVTSILDYDLAVNRNTIQAAKDGAMAFKNPVDLSQDVRKGITVIYEYTNFRISACVDKTNLDVRILELEEIDTKKVNNSSTGISMPAKLAPLIQGDPTKIAQIVAFNEVPFWWYTDKDKIRAAVLKAIDDIPIHNGLPIKPDDKIPGVNDTDN